MCDGPFSKQYIVVTGSGDSHGNFSYEYYMSSEEKEDPSKEKKTSNQDEPEKASGDSSPKKGLGAKLANKVRKAMAKSAGFTTFTNPTLFRQLYSESLLPKDAADINPETAMRQVRHLRRLCSGSYREINHLRKVG